MLTILHIPAVKQALLPWVENVCTDQIVVEARRLASMSRLHLV